MSEKLYVECSACGRSLLKTAPKCPGCGKSQRFAGHKIRRYALFAVVGWITYSAVHGIAMNSEAINPSVAETTDVAPIPASQESFVSIAGLYRDQFNANSNPVVRKELRSARAHDLMTEGVGPSVKDWVGTVRSIDVAGEAATLSVEIGDHVSLVTWNNRVSDFEDNTLIPRGSDVYRAVMGLQRGDRIFMSGELIPGEADTFKETSLTMDGSMQDPEYLFRFHAISPVQ